MSNTKMGFNEYRALTDQEREILRVTALNASLADHVAQFGNSYPAQGSAAPVPITAKGEPQKLLTHSQFLDAVAAEMNVDRSAVTAAIVAISAVVTKEVAAGGGVSIPGIGTVQTRSRRARADKSVREDGLDAPEKMYRSVVITADKQLRDAAKS